MTRKTVSRYLILILVAAVSTGCGLTDTRLLPDDGDGGAIVDPTLSTEEITLRLFFPHWQDSIVLAEEREVTVYGGLVEQSAVAALLEGPHAPYLKAPLPAGAQLLSLEVVDGVAYVNLSSAAASVEGALAEMASIRSLVFTLTDLETVQRVQILIEGKTNMSLGGQFILGEPMSRHDFGGTGSAPGVAAASDQILVFWPSPDSYYARAIPLWGIAQVYEAHLVYELWVDGALKAEGFITGTDFDWGMFSGVIPVDGITGDSAILRVYSPSAEDGSPRHMVEIPVKLTEPEVVAESAQIRVFSPAPESEVSGTFAISGIAQVYEAHLVYELRKGETLVAQGFTTTSDFDWGTFYEEITVPAGWTGSAVLRIYSPSAKDGSAMFTVQIPLILR